MFALGVNSVYHESAAAIVADGRVVAAAEEERFTRRKHGKPARVENAHDLPVHSIAYCLAEAGIAGADVDRIAYSFDPEIRERHFAYDAHSKPGDWGDPQGEAVFRSSLAQVPDALADVLGGPVRDRLVWVPHHLAHAASAYYPSGFRDAAILVVDGIGEASCGLMASGEGTRIRRLREIAYPDSLGFLWEKLSRYLGFSEYDACKVMGLAAYGDARAGRARFERFVHVGADGFTLDPNVLVFRLDSFDGLEALLGPRRKRGDPVEPRHADIAAALQCCTNEIALTLVRALYAERPSRNLCLAGGTSLNCTSNWLIKERGPFEEIFIPSAPHDAGTAVGAALFMTPRRHGSPAVRNGCASAYLGPVYDDGAIAAALREFNLAPRRSDDVAAEAAELLAAGKIVGWFQGRMEFGPRALGNRSLLADPRDPASRERMNRQVKRRETFRPFAPSVLEERSDAWFEIGRESPSYDYMLFACPVRADKIARIPAVTHVDGTARIQIVRRAVNPRFHALIARFEELTGVPLVLNTSFNDNEPIVCSPADALRTFVQTGIDALAVGDFIVTGGHA